MSDKTNPRDENLPPEVEPTEMKGYYGSRLGWEEWWSPHPTLANALIMGFWIIICFAVNTACCIWAFGWDKFVEMLNYK